MSIEKLVEECARDFQRTMYDASQNHATVYSRSARAVIRRTLEYAAGEIYPTHRRACACTRCDCGNFGDAQSVADWDAREDCSNHIRSLKAEG